MGLTIDFVIWDDPDEVRSNVRHIAINELTPEEVEEVLFDPASTDHRSRSAPHRLAKAGWTSTGRYVFVVLEIESSGPVAVSPVTAFEIDPP